VGGLGQLKLTVRREAPQNARPACVVGGMGDWCHSRGHWFEPSTAGVIYVIKSG